VNANDVTRDLEDALNRIDLNTVDIVTFSGCGEPTLNPALGVISGRVKEKIGNIPMALLTNASLIYRSDIRSRLSDFDVVVAKLDAGDEETFKRINRPADDKLTIRKVVESIKLFKEEFSGSLHLEVMLLESFDGKISNVMGKRRENLIESIVEVDPDVVQLEVPYRPPSVNSVRVPAVKIVESISDELTGILGEKRVWAYGRHDRRGRKVSWLTHRSLEDEVLEMLRRRPCRIVDVSVSMGLDLESSKRIIQKLENEGLITSRIKRGERFYFKKD